jgi:hypothetical protein
MRAWQDEASFEGIEISSGLLLARGQSPIGKPAWGTEFSNFEVKGTQYDPYIGEHSTAKILSFFLYQVTVLHPAGGFLFTEAIFVTNKQQAI